MLIDCWEVSNFHQSRFCCSRQDGISHTHYVGVECFVRERFSYFISDGLHLQDFLWGGLKNMSPGYGRSSHSLLSITTMRLHDTSLTFTFFGSPLSGGLLPDFLASFLWMLLHPLWVFICRALILPRIVYFFSTIIIGDVVKVSLGFLIIVFCFTFIIPSFTTLLKHKLIYDSLGWCCLLEL